MTTRKNKKIESIKDVLRRYGIKDESGNKDSKVTPEEQITELAGALNNSDLADLKVDSSDSPLPEINDGDFNEFDSVNDDESVDVGALLQEVDTLKKRVNELVSVVGLIINSFISVGTYASGVANCADRVINKLKENSGIN